MKEKLEFELADGRKVMIRGFHVAPTYRGLISHEPTPLINRLIVKAISFPKEWGQRRHIIKKDTLYTTNGLLRPYLVNAWLIIDPSIDANSDNYGKTIVVSFMTQNIETKTIEEIVLNEIMFSNWQQYAVDYII